ncbi:FAD-binding oxidoreductase [Xanthobacter autotrophicus]|uniref:FAD-binding oxidoreductase n=1 Tax=Xanthobacter TaxID=279 RepID=UPI0024AAA569|nr:FAD-binding oxidoreductase [Xanthobacter autotrophicus]MDI4666146.1 FAD-binding oxidoreductase [Xanthobacter autotrophicus]
MTARPDPAVLDRLRLVMGPAGVLDSPADTAPFRTSFGGIFRGEAALVLRPASTQEVAEVVRLCAEGRIPIVPQGGNTGLAGGAQPDGSGASVILSVDRMRKVRAVDVVNDTLTVEAGVTLAEVQAVAERVDRLFPLTLASEGSCRIGGNLATNAGGTQVLRYGNMRALALGLEVVLPDGRIWDGLRGLRKDNAGYDLKQLFIGSEGTLGIITAAVLRLFPRPRATATTFAAIPDPAAAIAFLGLAKARLGDSLSAFELMRAPSLAHAVAAVPGLASPFAEAYPWYLLVEASAQEAGEGLGSALEGLLAQGLEEGLVLDAVIAASGAQRRNLWALREAQAEAQAHAGKGVKHDISVPVSAIPAFVARADAALLARFPGILPFTFGHVGDGNLHYNPVMPADWTDEMRPARAGEINRIVHDVVADLGGSISAEHGLGQLRVAEAEHYKSAVELDLMRAVKAALDPHGLMNPGKVLRAR